MTRIRPTTGTRLGTVRITIPEFDLLNPADEVRLARAIEAGVLAAEALNRDENPLGASAEELRQLVAAGHAAQRGFFLANLKLVASISHQWATRATLPVDELFQEGCVGLGEAIRRWDHCRGSKFSSFAYPLVEGAIMGAPLPLGQSLLLIWPQLTCLIAATILLFALAYLLFQRQEIRA